MSLQPSISGRAEADLTNQYRWYRDNAGVEVAERFLAAFDATLGQIANMPNMGRLRRFRSSALWGMRSRTIRGGFGAHLIFYTFNGRTLSIERVMHGARDLEQRLSEPPEPIPPP